MQFPGSAGERELQQRHGTAKRAAAFYDKQMLDHLNPLMRDFIARMEMAFVSTADGHGECDCTFRAGPPGFMRVLDDRTLVYPEFRGNGVMASLGNISENPHVGILFVDFLETAVGLHVNGRASIVECDELLEDPDWGPRLANELPAEDAAAGPRRPAVERWVKVEVVEAYIHCSKHIPQLRRLDKDIDWGTDDTAKKGGDFFKAKHSSRPWQVQPAKPARVAAVAAAEAEPVEAEPPVAVPALAEAPTATALAHSARADAALDVAPPPPVFDPAPVPAPATRSRLLGRLLRRRRPPA